MLKNIYIVLFFYALILLQVSFFMHFPIHGITLNFVMVAVILINLISSQNGSLGITSAVAGGFYLDVFSVNFFGFFGFYTLVFLIFSLLVKFIFKKHVRVSLAKRS